ncbi:hydroxyacid dehydrogenase, partial [Helicobacter pylori]|nr:hydroxyacid dehydrogenase [Helicobacter pylori]
KTATKPLTVGGEEVEYNSPKKKKEGYERVSLKNPLTKSGINSIHAPLNESTHDLIALKKLQSLKDGAVLINVGRGGIVNEKDLAGILETKDLYYASDVFVKEPFEKDHAFLNPKIQNKLLLTPHIAWAYSDSLKTLVEKTKENIQDFLASQK